MIRKEEIDGVLKKWVFWVSGVLQGGGCEPGSGGGGSGSGDSEGGGGDIERTNIGGCV